MTQEHPITPPHELIRQWTTDATFSKMADQRYIATYAARWGADQELEACCEWLKTKEWIHPEFSDELRDLRRPKPPSLKEQAEAELNRLIALIPTEGALAMAEPIRRALESLPD